MDKTIKEDYVSYKIAKLLKEKGFNEPCRAYYKMGGLKEDMTVPRDWNHSVYLDHTSAPTLQMAVKWLREVHKWSIQVFPVFDTLKWCYDIYELKIQKYQSRPDLLSNVDYDSYEEACEESLKYCLMNLIK